MKKLIVAGFLACVSVPAMASSSFDNNNPLYTSIFSENIYRVGNVALGETVPEGAVRITKEEFLAKGHQNMIKECSFLNDSFYNYDTFQKEVENAKPSIYWSSDNSEKYDTRYFHYTDFNTGSEFLIQADLDNRVGRAYGAVPGLVNIKEIRTTVMDQYKKALIENKYVKYDSNAYNSKRESGGYIFHEYFHALKDGEQISTDFNINYLDTEFISFRESNSFFARSTDFNYKSTTLHAFDAVIEASNKELEQIKNTGSTLWSSNNLIFRSKDAECNQTIVRLKSNDILMDKFYMHFTEVQAIQSKHLAEKLPQLKEEYKSSIRSRLFPNSKMYNYMLYNHFLNKALPDDFEEQARVIYEKEGQ